MPITPLDPRPALVVIDLQNGITAVPVVHDISIVIGHAAALADAFRAADLPVVLVTVTGGAPGRSERSLALAGGSVASGQAAPVRPADWADLVPELEGEGIRIVKRTWGAFHETTLHEQLQQLGVTQIVLAGISTSKGVETTARAAFEHGYNVVLATDAMTDSDAAVHANSVENIFPALGETGTTAEVLALLRAANAPVAADVEVR